MRKTDNEPHHTHTELYAALNLGPTASRTDVQRAFKHLSRHFHPDKIGDANNKAAQDTFRLIRLAHDVLADRVLRLVYDVAGLPAVDLVLRSHYRAKRQQETDQERNKTEKRQSYNNTSENSNDDNDNSSDDTNNSQKDLYVNIQRAPTRQEAIQIIAEFMESYNLTQAISLQPPLDATLICPLLIGEQLRSSIDDSFYNIGDKTSSLFDQYGSPTLSISTKRRPLPKLEVGLTTTTLLRRIGRMEAWTQYSFTPYHSSFGPLGTLDLYFDHTAPAVDVNTQQLAQNLQTMPIITPWPLFKVKSSRTFINGTYVNVGLAGDLRDGRTWMYTLATSRTLGKYNVDNEESNDSSSNKKGRYIWVASWQIAVSTRGPIQFLEMKMRQVDPKMTADNSNNSNNNNASARTSAITQWPKTLWRLRLDSLTMQVEYSKLLFEYTRHSLWSKFKILYRFALASTKWKCEVGLSFNGRGRLDAKRWIGGPAWKVLFHLQSHEWDIRIPITLSPWTEPILQSVLVAGLIGACLDDFAEECIKALGASTTDRNNNNNNKFKNKANNSTVPPSAPFTSVLSVIADQKRQAEMRRNGLVIIQATIQNDFSHDHVDIKDHLQFWVVNGHLQVDLTSLRNWWPSTQSYKKHNDVEFKNYKGNKDPGVFSNKRKEITSWLKSQLWFTNKSPSDSDSESIGKKLYVRYEYQDFVYEVSIDNCTKLELPHPNATQIGRLGRVQ